MEYYGVVAGALALFAIALVSLLATSQAIRDQWGLKRSRINQVAIALWALMLLTSLASGVTVAWVADGMTSPSPSW